MNGPEALASRWRETADQLRHYAAREQAEVLEACAADLEGWWREYEREVLSLEEAAIESGFSEDHLGRLVRERKLPNAGKPGAPRIRRQDLPTKGSRRQEGNGTRAELAERILRREGP